MKEKISQVIVVEGRDDTANLKRYFDVDTYEIIKSEGVGPRGGIMHSFSGSLEWAEKFVELGMTISFSGVVTFKKSDRHSGSCQKSYLWIRF